MTPCSSACSLAVDEFSFTCDDNGTSSDPTDDFYTIEVNASGQNTGISNQYTVAIGSDTFGPFTYGLVVSFDYPATGNIATLVIEDVDNLGCIATEETTELVTCSDACILDAPLVSNITCNDNGTTSDATDDTFTFDLEVSGNNIGGSYEISSLSVTAPYNTVINVGPFLISDGVQTLTISDIDDPACIQEIMVTPPNTCSDACNISILTSEVGTCNDNNTGADSSDDTFDLTIQVTGVNVSSTNEYFVTDGITIYGPYNYDVDNIITDLPANGIDIEFTIYDSEDNDCSTVLTVSQESCSECLQTMDAGSTQTISCTVTEIMLNATTSEAGTYNWTGPNFSSNMLNPIVTEPGIYYLEIIYDNLCSDIDSVIVDLDEDVPVADPGPDQIITCDDELVILGTENTTQGSGITYEWTNEDNEVVSNDLFYETSTPGIYFLQVIDTANDCESPLTSVLVIDNTDAPSVAIYTSPDNIINCLIESVDLSTDNETNVEYTWSIDDQSVVASTFTTTASGTITLTAIDTITGCFATGEIEIIDGIQFPIIEIEEPLAIQCNQSEITIDASASLTGNNISHQWLDSNNDTIVGETSLTLTVTEPGTYYMQSVDAESGCQNIDEIVVPEDLEYPIAEAGDEISIDCFSDEALLSSNGSTEGEDISYTWTNAAGQFISNELVLMVNESGLYFLEVIDETNGCANIDSVLVLDPIMPEIEDIIVEDPLCFGENNGIIEILNVVGGIEPYNYSLNFGAVSTEPYFDNLAPGIYTLSIEDANGCISDTEIILEDGNDLELTIDAITEIKLGESTELMGSINIPLSEIETTIWTPEDSLSCVDCMTTIASPVSSTTYTLTVIDKNGCEVSAEIRIAVDRRPDVYIPNVFSPNEDGENDMFTLYSSEVVERVDEVYIYDRWGELVFSNQDFDPNDETMGWDGTFRGQDVNPGVFAYIYRVTLIDGTEKIYSGSVTVIR